MSEMEPRTTTKGRAGRGASGAFLRLLTNITEVRFLGQSAKRSDQAFVGGSTRGLGKTWISHFSGARFSFARWVLCALQQRCGFLY